MIDLTLERLGLQVSDAARGTIWPSHAAAPREHFYERRVGSRGFEDTEALITLARGAHRREMDAAREIHPGLIDISPFDRPVTHPFFDTLAGAILQAQRAVQFNTAPEGTLRRGDLARVTGNHQQFIDAGVSYDYQNAQVELDAPYGEGWDVQVHGGNYDGFSLWIPITMLRREPT